MDTTSDERKERSFQSARDLLASEGRRMNPRRKGAVLLLVLVMIVVVSFAMIEFTERGLSEIAGEGYYVERSYLRTEAYSALETSLAVLADVIFIDGSLQAPIQGWGDPLVYAGVSLAEGTFATIRYTDESGKLPLNELDEGTLYLLFTEMEFEVDDSLKLTNSLLDWIDEDDATRIDGAELDEYGLAEMPFAASNRPIRRLEELSIVDGFRSLFFTEEGHPNEHFFRFAEAVSPYGSSSINVNAASELALISVGGLSELQVEAIMDHRAGSDGIIGTEDDRYFASQEELLEVIVEMPEGSVLNVISKIMTIEIQVTEGNADFFLRAVVSLDGSGSFEEASQTEQKNSSSSSQATTSDESSYPFIFLELTEDVSINETIASPENFPSDPPS
ncbi:MAG: general secretion pathway protein GspK [Opitutaceae bacterium]|nr:general secretion pathway protein GspK [Opitutaceae bacterium]